MRKKYVLIILLTAAIAVAAAAAPVLYRLNYVKPDAENKTLYVNLWQIDGFEGGKGSRKSFIESTAKKLFKGEKIYFTVTSLTAEAARANIALGVIPEMVSYPSGFYGIENMVNAKDFVSRIWCYGCYCLLTLDTESDFGDVNSDNTVVNSGKDNLAGVCAALVGAGGAVEAEPTNAYLQLLNGKYKYLLGTQRDIYRLETREASYSAKPVAEFSDLFQNVSILTDGAEEYAACRRLAEELVKSDVGSLGLFGNDGAAVPEQLKALGFEGAEYALKGLSSERYINELKEAAKNGDIKKLKSILR